MLICEYYVIQALPCLNNVDSIWTNVWAEIIFSPLSTLAT